MMNVAVLALGSLREALRDRLLYTLFGLGAILLLVLAMMSPLTLGARGKTFHDAGLAWLHLSGFLTMLVLGAWSLHRERERGIWLSILTRPVSRQEFLLGRITGLLSVLAVTLLAITSLYLLVGWIAGVPPQPGLSQALIYIFLEMSILAGLILFFATFTGFAMTVMLSLTLFCAGHFSPDILRFAAMVDNKAVSIIAGCVHWIMPHMEIYRVRHALVEGQLPNPAQMLSVLGYTVLYLTALLGLSAAIFSRREIR